MLAILAPIRQIVVNVRSEAGRRQKVLPQPAPCSTSLKYRVLSAVAATPTTLCLPHSRT
jgi:hypothetical protein